MGEEPQTGETYTIRYGPERPYSHARLWSEVGFEPWTAEVKVRVNNNTKANPMLNWTNKYMYSQDSRQVFFSSKLGAFWTQIV